MATENLLYAVRSLIQKRKERTLVLITCLLSAFCGIACLSVGLIILFQTSATNIALIGELGAKTLYIRPAAFLMVSSGIIALIGGLLGCAACVFEKKVLLFLFISGIAIICILVLVAFVLALLYRYTVFRTADVNAKKKFDEDIGKNDTNEIERIWKPLQMELWCCGLTGAEDYLRLLNKTRASFSLPLECCVFDRVGDSKPMDREKCSRWVDRFIHERGCIQLIRDRLMRNIGLISLAAALTIWIQLPAGYTALLLFSRKNTTEQSD